MREEADNATAAATESVEVAMAQVASANQRCQRETKRREALEVRLDQLQEEFDAQKGALADLSKLGHGWETERKNLVDTLQRECNSVFDRTKSASPHSVTTEFFADIELAERQRALSPLGERASVNSEIRSPTFTELDRTLRETEAFVEKVLSS
jgi:chromosome segregation ATPase